MKARIAEWLRGMDVGDILFAALITAVLLLIGFYSALLGIVSESLLLDGSTVNGIDVSGMDPDRAMEHVIESENDRLLSAVSVTIDVQGDPYTYNSSDFGAATDASEAVANLFDNLRKGNLVSRANAYFAFRRGASCPIALSFSPEMVERACQSLGDKYEQEPVIASMRLNEAGDDFDYVPERNGTRIDLGELYSMIWERLEQGGQGVVPITLVTVYTASTVQSLQENTMALATCETEMNAQDAQAAQRLLALLNGYSLHAGEKLSLRALLYADGDMPEDEVPIASQIASTLYNALLLAGGDKLERFPNEWPPSYVPIGLDAALNSECDLVMRNGTKFPMYILAGIQDDQIRIIIYGRLGRVDEQYQIRSMIVRTIEPDPPIFIDDPTLPSGKSVMLTKASEGYRVSSYREVLRDDAVISSELLAMDIYPAVQEVYRRGIAR